MRKDDRWMSTQMDGQNCYISIQGAATWRIQWHVIPEPRSTLWVLPLREFNVTIPELQCHDPRTYHIAGWKYSIRHIENRFSPYFIYCFLNAVWALVSSGFRIVSDTLVCFAIHASRQPGWYLASLAVISPPATSLMPISIVSPTTDAHLRTRCRWSHWNVINWHRSSPGLLQKKQVPSTCFPLGRK